MKKPRKTRATSSPKWDVEIVTPGPKIDLEAYIKNMIKECIKVEIEKVTERIDYIEDGIPDGVNEAMQEFKVDAEAIDGLREAVVEILDDATICID